MKRRLFFVLLVTGLILLALAGWTVEGMRRLAAGRPAALPHSA